LQSSIFDYLYAFKLKTIFYRHFYAIKLLKNNLLQPAWKMETGRFVYLLTIKRLLYDAE